MTTPFYILKKFCTRRYFRGALCGEFIRGRYPTPQYSTTHPPPMGHRTSARMPRHGHGTRLIPIYSHTPHAFFFLYAVGWICKEYAGFKVISPCFVCLLCMFIHLYALLYCMIYTPVYCKNRCNRWNFNTLRRFFNYSDNKCLRKSCLFQSFYRFSGVTLAYN